MTTPHGGETDRSSGDAPQQHARVLGPFGVPRHAEQLTASDNSVQAQIDGQTVLRALPGARVVNAERVGRPVTQIAYDSRSICQPFAAFAAVTVREPSPQDIAFYELGTKRSFDHHEYIPNAIKAGARTIICESLPESIDPDVLYIQVPNVIAALGDLARHLVRDRGRTVIGVTGSSGKTTTCQAVASTVGRGDPSTRLDVHRSTPITVATGLANRLLSSATSQTTVVELPTDHHGCIAALARISAPRIGVVLNVKDAHLNVFGSLRGTTQAKAELIEALPDDGIAVLNVDDPHVRSMAEVAGQRRVMWFGRDGRADVRGEIVRQGQTSTVYEISFAEKPLRVELPLIGRQSLYIALAAATAGLACGMSPDAIEAGLSRFQPLPGRMSWRERNRGTLVVFDNSAKSNLTNFRDLVTAIAEANLTGRRILVLGSFDYYEHPYPEPAVWRAVTGLFDEVILYGAAARKYEGALRPHDSVPTPTIRYADDDLTAANLILESAHKSVQGHSYVVVTGYYDVHLSHVVDRLVEITDD